MRNSDENLRNMWKRLRAEGKLIGFPDDWDEEAYIKEEKAEARKAQVEKERPEINETENIDGKSFEQMTPDEFEDAVCKLFNAFGYNLSVTQRSKDGGIDLDGLGAGLGQTRVVVQCKRYSSPVGVSVVRELFGVVSDDPEIAEGFLVTTSTFTQEAQAFARGKRITLVDGAELEMRFSKLADAGFSNLTGSGRS